MRVTYQQLGFNVLSSFNSRVPSSYLMKSALSAIPTITNIFYSTTGVSIEPAPTQQIISIDIGKDNNFFIYGTSFGKVIPGEFPSTVTTSIFLSANTTDFVSGGVSLVTDYQKITSAQSSEISGYKLNDNFYTILNDNVATIFIPTSTLSGAATNTAAPSGRFVFIVRNIAGWASSYQASSSIINIV